VIVVSDSSPIIALDAAGHLELLHRLYGEVLIPAAVETEILGGGIGAPGVAAVTNLPWIRVGVVSDRTLLGALLLQLDTGEAEAIALAVQAKADLLLIDERRARRSAQNLGVKVVGLIAVLLEAKRQGLLSAVRPVLDSLSSQSGFWISQALYDHAVKVAGE